LVVCCNNFVKKLLARILQRNGYIFGRFICSNSFGSVLLLLLHLSLCCRLCLGTNNRRFPENPMNLPFLYSFMCVKFSPRCFPNKLCRNDKSPETSVHLSPFLSCLLRVNINVGTDQLTGRKTTYYTGTGGNKILLGSKCLKTVYLVKQTFRLISILLY